MSTRAAVLVGGGAFAITAFACGQTAELIVLPRTPGNRVPVIRNVSGDGQVVIGMAGGSNGTPFRWTEESGYHMFPSGSGYPHPIIYSCSDDGSVVAGYGNHSTLGAVAFLWYADDSIEILRDQAGNALRTAYKISGDGLTVAGEIAATPNQAAYWKVGVGLTVIGDSPFDPDFPTGLLAVNNDGTVFGGVSAERGQRAFQWSAVGGYAMVGDLGGSLGGAFVSDMTSMGDVLVGDASAPAGRVAYMWREGFGIQPIPVIPGDSRPTANAVSADGRVVVGKSASSVVSHGVLYYTEGVGSVYLEDHLNSNFGFSLAPAALYEGLGVSNDGRTIVGGGNTLGYWVVRLPQASLTDFNIDEFVDFHDLIFFLDCFEGNSILPVSSADLNHDGFTDFFDFIEFLDHF